MNKLGFKVSVFNIYKLKPLHINISAIENLKSVKYFGIVSDDDYVDGIAKNIAYDLIQKLQKK